MNPQLKDKKRSSSINKQLVNIYGEKYYFNDRQRSLLLLSVEERFEEFHC